MKANSRHQYVDRASGQIRNERLFGNRVVNALYGTARERAPLLFRTLTGVRFNGMLAALNYDWPLTGRLTGNGRFMRQMGIDLAECLDPPERLNTLRKVFERRIRYWECRPMPEDSRAIVSPADARVVVGSLCEHSRFFIKDKFFGYEELLGREPWLEAFRDGDFAVFRLTPDKYHHNHAPVAGRVVALYEIDGAYHSCNPAACVRLVTPYSKNRRVVTIIDTDVDEGSGVGLVAMIEIVALMIGEIAQCYSERCYDHPRPVTPGQFLQKGQPKSLYRPGSSTDVLLFQTDRLRFADDLLRNQLRPEGHSRLTRGFGQPLLETDVRVRSWIGTARQLAPNEARRANNRSIERKGT